MSAPKALGSARRWIVISVLVVALGIAAPVFSAIVLRTTVTTGTAPSAIALNPISGRVYVANYFGGTTSVLDAATESKLATLSMGAGLTVPNSVVVNAVATPPRAYVANFWAGTVSVIDESSLTVTRTIASAGYHGSGSPRALAVDVAGATPKLYVAEYGRNSVAVYNAETYAFIKRITVGSAPRALGIFSAVGHRRIFVANRFSNTVSIIDGDTDTVIGQVAVGAAPKAIAIDTSTGWAWVTSELGNTVTAIDATDNATRTVAVGNKPEGLAVDATGGRVYVANYNSATVTVIRTSDFGIDGTVSVGTGPWAVAYDSGDKKAYVACYNGDSVSIIDGTLAATTVTVGDGPYALAVDENTTPHKIFVANRLGHTISVLGDNGLGWLVPRAATAYAVDVPVANVTVDSVTTDASTGKLVLAGTATSARRFPAAILALTMRVDDAGAWQRAAIVAGAGSTAVSWRLELDQLAVGKHTLAVRVYDQTSAAASSSDGAGADKGFSAASSLSIGFSNGAVLQPKRGVACASCHGTPERGNRKKTPAPLARCPRVRR